MAIENTVSTNFDPRPPFVKSVFDCLLPGVIYVHDNCFDLSILRTAHSNKMPIFFLIHHLTGFYEKTINHANGLSSLLSHGHCNFLYL